MLMCCEMNTLDISLSDFFCMAGVGETAHECVWKISRK
jgi:hypothetical protein